MASYKSDPRWIVAKFDSMSNGTMVRKGTKCWYYPATKTILTGEAAEQAALDFYAARSDEDFMAR